MENIFDLEKSYDTVWVFMSLSAAQVISRRDKNPEPRRNSLLFTNSSRSLSVAEGP